MQMTKKGPVYQLTFMPRFFPVNCYVIDEETELTLIDAALGFNAKQILLSIKVMKKPLTQIIITHAHGDHMGALDAIKREWPDAVVSISARDARLLAGDTSLLPDEPDSPIKGGVPKNIKTQPDRLLEEGDQVGSLKVVSTPGHTPGSISLLDSRNQFLIAGDALQTRGGIAVSGTFKVFFPFPAFATWNKQEALKSAHKIRRLNPQLLAVGHGEMINKPMDSIDLAIFESEKNLQ
ncbi:glyoxylase-like metal-dependent hydrolase (beta-lactamase superfamily II) [Planomicrobium stackebrandtii]|uniref:Glyoxylase-like metal-dependent hydrolase (Beta-lactamase superfamily II) n=1 Tax=Planomicrobium stackebrandtii TaxID=253160 RepID=A0ABU0GWG1_9BACL|nr:MBL fold metallo-hydrolase [Planomicrobium stackebrandtii]MDQ0428890.1 glyoxylase-like metal-dependent hydrolase (beta-lactamase superfamily II) [Planomicrobium stackebrandtii]